MDLHTRIQPLRLVDACDRLAIDGRRGTGEVVVVVGQTNVHNVADVRTGINGEGDIVDDICRAIFLYIHGDDVAVYGEAVVLGQGGLKRYEKDDGSQQHRDCKADRSRPSGAYHLGSSVSWYVEPQ